jgi:hypothetical protein
MTIASAVKESGIFRRRALRLLAGASGRNVLRSLLPVLSVYDDLDQFGCCSLA